MGTQRKFKDATRSKPGTRDPGRRPPAPARTAGLPQAGGQLSTKSAPKAARPPDAEELTTRLPPESARPFVLVNMAMTVDGKIATANRAVRTFGSPADRAAMLALRATADAVMAGARTVDSDEVDLGPGPSALRQERLRAGLQEYNLRVIVSGSGSMDPKAHIFQKRFSPILLLTTERITAQRRKELEAVADVVKTCGCNEIDFNLAFRWLYDQWNVRRLLVEGGGDLNAGLFRAGLVDELHLTLCPWIVGGDRAPTIADGLGAVRLQKAAQFELKSMKPLGRELYLVYRRAHAVVSTPMRGERGPSPGSS